MADDVEKLLIRLEVTQRKFERQMQAAYKSADTNAKRMEGRFARANKNITRSFDRLGRSAGNTMGRIGRLAAIAAAAFGTREIARYADGWTRLENKIRAAEQISGVAARTTADLNDIAARSRSGIEETADLYAKLLRTSGQLGASEEDVATATETVAKSFKAGGAAASEQAAGILQLGQALGSGFLQGDELRSLRENAPLIAQAIADEFGTTIAGLKQLGADGELTSDRVFKAIVSGQGKIEAAFASTNPTIAEGFTLLKNGAMEFIGAFNEGSDAAGGLSSKLADLGGFLSDNVDAARRFGAQVSEAFAIVGEAFDALAGDVDFGGIVSGASDAAVKTISIFVDLAQAVTSTVAGVAAAIKQAFINAIAATGDGGIGIANKTIEIVESILNFITRGVQKVVDGINVVIQTANKLKGINIPEFGAIGDVTLGRIDPASIKSQVKPIGDAFTDAAQDAADSWQVWEDGVVGSINRIKTAAQLSDEDTVMGQSVLKPKAPTKTTTTTTTSNGGKGGGGKSKTETPFFESVQKEITALENKISMLGMTQAEIAEYTAKQELLNEAKKRGLDLDAVSAETGLTLREEIDRQAAAVGRLTAEYEKLKFVDDLMQDMKDGMIDAIVEGENLAGVFADLAKQIAKAALQAALFGEGPLASMGQGSLLGGIFGRISGGLGGLLSFDGGGYTGSGPRSGGVDGKGGFPTILHPKETVIDHTKMMRPPAPIGAASRGGQAPSVTVSPAEVRVAVLDDPRKIGEFLSTAEGQAVFVETARRSGVM